MKINIVYNSLIHLKGKADFHIAPYLKKRVSVDLVHVEWLGKRSLRNTNNSYTSHSINF